MTTTKRPPLSSILFGFVGLALLIGSPIILWQVVGNPFLRFPTSLDQFAEHLQQRYLAVDTVVGIIAVLLWLLWLQYVWAFMWEIAVVGPALKRGEVGRSAPFAPKLVRSIASTVVSGMLTAGLVASSSSVATLIPHVVPQALALEQDSDDTADRGSNEGTPRSDRNEGEYFYIASDSDTLWRIANEDPSIVKQLLEMNDNALRSAMDLRPGMRLAVPGKLATHLGIEQPTVEPVESPSSVLPEHSHEVQPGDNLWNLAKQRLLEAGNPNPSNGEIAEELKKVIDRNQAIVEDPDLIYPGEDFVLPEIPLSSATELGDGQSPDSSQSPALPRAETPPTRVEAPPTRIEAPPPVEEQTPTPTRTEANATETSKQGSDTNPAPEQAASSESPPDGPSLPARPEGRPAAADRPGGSQTSPDGGRRPILDTSSLEKAARSFPVQAAAAATGVLAIYLGLKRKRDNAYGYGFSRRAASAIDLDLVNQLSRVGDPDFIVWAADQLNELVSSLPDEIVAAPLGVNLIQDEGVRVIWSEPIASAFHEGWESTEEGWLKRFDVAELRSNGGGGDEEHGRAAIPGLVTVGDLTSGSGRGQLLIDLEAFGSLAIGGSEGDVDAVVRGMVLDLGAGAHLSNAFVTTVGFEIEGTEQLERVKSSPESEAIDELRAVVEQYDSFGLDERGSFGWDAGTENRHDVEVFVVKTAEASLESWLDLVRPRSGVALILAGDLRTSRVGSRLYLDEDGSASVTPLGKIVKAFGTSHEHASRLAVLLDSVGQVPIGADSQRSATEVMIEWSSQPDTETGRKSAGPPADLAADALEAAGIEYESVVHFGPEAAEVSDTGPLDPFVGNNDDSPIPTNTKVIHLSRDDVIEDWGLSPTDDVQVWVDENSDVQKTESIESTDQAGEDGDGRSDEAGEDSTGQSEEHSLRIRVLGQCACDERPQLAGVALSIVAFIAVQPDKSTTSDILISRIWGDRKIDENYFQRVVSAARSALGARYFPKQRAADSPLRLVNVETDLDELHSLALEAQSLPPEEALPVLEQAVQLVRGRVFQGSSVNWAASSGFIDYASELIEATSLQTIKVAGELGRNVEAKRAALAGLRALPANELIYRARMQIAFDEGDIKGVRSVYRELEGELSLQYPAEAVEPVEATRLLLDELTRPPEVTPHEEQPDSTHPKQQPGRLS